MKLETTLELVKKRLRLQQKAYSTEKAYCHWISRYHAWLQGNRQLASLSSTRKMELFLTHLADDKVVAAKTQNQAFNAVRYLYKEVLKQDIGNVDSLRAKEGEQVRRAPKVSEIHSLFEAMQDRNGYPVKLVCKLLYGCGMRVSEPLNLNTTMVYFHPEADRLISPLESIA